MNIELTADSGQQEDTGGIIFETTTGAELWINPVAKTIEFFTDADSTVRAADMCIHVELPL